MINTLQGSPMIDTQGSPAGGIFNHSVGSWNSTTDMDPFNTTDPDPFDEATTSEEEMVRLSSLTIRQEKVLSLVGILPGILSILGSSAILYKVLCNWRRAGPYDRLMLGLSACDIVATISYVSRPFLIPSDPYESESVRVYAVGNQGTCNWFLGWTTQFAFAAICYNGALSFYYLLTVRYSIKRQDFARLYEPWFHGSILVFFLGTATYGSAIGLFNELDFGFGCWVSDYPEGCEIDECTSYYYGIFMGVLPTALCLFALVFNNLRIFFYCREKLQVSKKGGVRYRKKRNPDSGSDDSEDGNSSRDQNTKTTAFSPFSGKYRSGGSVASVAVDDPNGRSGSALTREEWERSVRQTTQIKEVATQGFLYVLFFFVSYTPAFIVRVMEAMMYTQENEADHYVLLILEYFLLPLQGFFNMLVYTRPNYVRVRAAYPERSKFWAMKFACFSSEIPRMSEISVENISQTAVWGFSRRNLTGSMEQRFGFNSSLQPVIEGENEDASEPICIDRADTEVDASSITRHTLDL